MRILVTGASGQLGNELRRLLETGEAEIGPIPDCYAGAEVAYTDAEELDITDANAITNYVRLGKYDLIINCAAMTNVDGCEVAQDAAMRVNADAPGNLARVASETGAKLVQVSTDYVFPGTESRPRVEDDPAGPISAYGRTKFAGEVQVAQTCPRHFIVRTAWLYGYVGSNFVKTMMHLGENSDKITVVDDQLGNPTSANDLAYEMLKIAASDEYGIYHCTNEGTCSWADFAQAIMENAGLKCEIIRCTSEEYAAINPASARRPAYSSLQNKHLEDTIGNEMRAWQEAFATYMLNLATLGA